MPNPTPGQIAYAAYVVAVERRPIAAEVTTAMWTRLMPHEQRVWEAAAQAVLDAGRHEAQAVATARVEREAAQRAHDRAISHQRREEDRA
jgi:hypothetical protein